MQVVRHLVAGYCSIVLCVATAAAIDLRDLSGRSDTSDSTMAYETELDGSRDPVAPHPQTNPDNGGNYCGSCYHCYPRSYASADVLFLKRDNHSANQSVVLDGATLDTILTTNDLGFDAQSGLRLIAGVQLCPYITWEASYFGLHDWDSSITAVGNDDLRIPGDIALASLDFLDADTIRLDYSSKLHNAEINLVRELCWEGVPIQWLVGFRYVRLSEEFNINSTDLDTGTSDYNIRTNNDLFGGQIGVRYREQSCGWSWDISGKAGIYGNAAKQSTFLGDFDNTFIFRNLSVAGGRAAFAGELNFNLEYRLNCAWSIRGGYNLLWIEGVALAPDQLDFTDTPASSRFLDRDGGVFYHGANVGLAARW